MELGATSVKNYIDDGYSGAYLERPALDNLRDAVAQKLHDCIVIYDIDRLSRDTMHLLLLTDELEKNARFNLALVKKVTGIEPGVNLFDINTGDCEEKLEARPYVQEADVSRKLPDTIQVSLTLREPEAVVLFNKKYVMLDGDGNVLEIRKQLPHYTFLEGLTVQEAKLGQPVKIKEEKKYQEYTSLLKKMNDADLYFRKIVIQENNIKLFVKKNLYCIGTKKNIIAGMEDGNLKAVLFAINKKGIEKGVVEVGDDQYYSYSKTAK